MITKDMIIGDVLKKYDGVALIMMEHGLHCVGCRANVHESIEAGAKAHGLSDEDIDKMVEQMNTFAEGLKSASK